ncbi:carboxymuconolactone decarboxylase family protein [Domibacillus enclensis]|uniref:4-carboxymuconolactone decarboxylase n=1 Tax=Domibacillus enclensis TaxID=1017273 RepID=A0A1N6TVH7_9BACI|nr:carboxymuconolactone decarboxylase family protein [Domibacillus enclensis]OXS78367.1 hypothetical protein B1B05_07080 [Domibacillus enclensis]SIQ57388.1 4-carboxymuconolactone decarboxylase [Domibacillus enclensis]
MNRFEKGLDVFSEYMDDGWEKPKNGQMEDPLDSVAPDFRRWIIEAYGEIYGRPHLDKKERALIVIASLVTQGAHTQLATHIKRGLNAGLTKEQLAECIIQCLPYNGFPRVQQALVILKQVIEE